MIDLYSLCSKSELLYSEKYKTSMGKLMCDDYSDKLTEIEHIIMPLPYYAINYARHVLKSRWFGAEIEIKKYQWWSYFYAKEVMKQRWYEVEEFIKTDAFWWTEYTLCFNLTDN